MIDEAADAAVFFDTDDFAEAATITPVDDITTTADVIIDKGVIREGGFDSSVLESHTEISVAKSVRANWLRGDVIDTASASYTVKRPLDDDGVVVVLHVDEN